MFNIGDQFTAPHYDTEFRCMIINIDEHPLGHYELEVINGEYEGQQFRRSLTELQNYFTPCSKFKTKLKEKFRI